MTNARFYNLVGSNYVPQFFVQDQLTHHTRTGEFILTDTTGDTLHFWDWTASQANEWGQLKSATDAMGNQISVTSYTSKGSVPQIQRSDGTTTQARQLNAFSPEEKTGRNRRPSLSFSAIPAR